MSGTEGIILTIKESGKKGEFPFKEKDFILIYKKEGTLVAIGDIAELPAQISVDKHIEVIKPDRAEARTIFTWTDVEEAYLLTPKNKGDWEHIKKHFFEERKLQKLDEDEEYHSKSRLNEGKRILLIILKLKANLRYSTVKADGRKRLR